MNTNTNPDAILTDAESLAIIATLTEIETSLIVDGMLKNPMRDGQPAGEIALWNDVLDTAVVMGRQVSDVVSSLVKKGVIGTTGRAVWFTVKGAEIARYFDHLMSDEPDPEAMIAEPAVIAEPASLLEMTECSMIVPDGVDPIVDRIRARRKAEADAVVLRYEFFAIGTIPTDSKNAFGAIRIEPESIVAVVGDAGKTAGFFFNIADRIGGAKIRFAAQQTFNFTRDRVGPMGLILARSYALSLFVRRVGEKIRMDQIAERGQYLLIERSGEYGIGFYVGQNGKGYEIEYKTVDPCDDKPKRFTVSYVGRGDGWRVVSVLSPIVSIGFLEETVGYMLGLAAEAPKA